MDEFTERTFCCEDSGIKFGEVVNMVDIKDRPYTPSEAFLEYLCGESGYRGMSLKDYLEEMAFEGTTGGELVEVVKQAFLEGIWWGARVDHNG